MSKTIKIQKLFEIIEGMIDEYGKDGIEYEFRTISADELKNRINLEINSGNKEKGAENGKNE